MHVRSFSRSMPWKCNQSQMKTLNAFKHYAALLFTEYWTSPFASRIQISRSFRFNSNDFTYFERNSLQTNTTSLNRAELINQQKAPIPFQLFFLIWIAIMITHSQRRCNVKLCSKYMWRYGLLNDVRCNAWRIKYHENLCVLERSYQMDRKSIKR